MTLSALLLSLFKVKLFAGIANSFAALAVRPVDAEVQGVLRGFADVLSHIASRPSLNG